jgi:hypothetical protein
MLAPMADWGSVLRRAAKAGLELLKARSGPAPARPGRAGGAPTAAAGRARSAPTADRARRIAYAPSPDGAADPGEIVWTWVPYEEDDGRGKDRPLLVVGRGSGDLLGLMLSSQQDHAGDRDWVSIGSGAWDREGRESFVRLDRVIEVDEHGIRREGAVLGRDRFDRVAVRLRDGYGWS